MTSPRSALSPQAASAILGVAVDAPWTEVRLAYRVLIGSHHPDRAGAGSADRAARINDAYRILQTTRRTTGPVPGPPHPSDPPPPPSTSTDARVEADPATSSDPGVAPSLTRVDHDTLVVDAPAEETFRWLIDAADDLGEITYLDRSAAILEVLCRFEGEPATSLVATLQGRANGTEVFCTVESIEDRAAPPAAAVIDLYELALRRRQNRAG